MTFGLGERSAWGHFPVVIRNAELGALKQEPEYRAAKGGDTTLALNMVYRALTTDTINAIQQRLQGRKPKLVPVLAEEASGRNKIPLAMAVVLSDALNLEVEYNIIQSDKVTRTNSNADHRLAFNPRFQGQVDKDQEYLILDDTLAMGGTIASLKGFIENRGGQVIGAAVMTAHQGSLSMPVNDKMLKAIERKHGPSVDQFWKETFGYGIDRLTQGEAGHLKSAKTFESIRDRVTTARNEGLRRRDEEATQKTQTESQTLNDAKDLVFQAHKAEIEQQNVIDTARLTETYEQTKDIYIQAKYDQVARLEYRLEHMIKGQESKVQQSLLSKPSIFSMPATKKSWDTLQNSHKSRLEQLKLRLHHVRDVKEEMTLHGPKLEQMAIRKMRAENEEIASSWDAQQKSVKLQSLHKKNNQKKMVSHVHKRKRHSIKLT